MQLTSFQPPELRDANNNVIQEGTYSVKNGVLANAQNTGVLDYINNNLQALQNNVVGLQSSSLVWEYVDQLPTPSEANPNSIYAVPQTDEQGNNYYIEYRLINGTWQVFGSTKVDITQAVMKTDVLDSIRADSTLPVQSKAILNALNEKPNVDDVYSKAETNTLLNNKANSSDLSNYLPLSGGTVHGDITLYNANTNSRFITKADTLERTVAPSSNVGWWNLLGRDKNNNSMGGVYQIYNTDKTTILNLMCYNSTTTDSDYARLGVGFDGNGKIFTHAPNPATTDNSNQIATTAFVKSNLANYSDIITYDSTTATSFKDLVGKPNTVNVCACIDKVASEIGGYSDSVGMKYVVNGGPAYGIVYIKANATYYSGIVFNYNMDGFVRFSYANGRRRLCAYNCEVEVL